jgi:hypothetical protein
VGNLNTEMVVKDNECFIPKEALSLANFSSKDNMSRPILTTLHIVNGVAETADGFSTASYKIKQGKDFPDCSIPMNDILHAGINKKWNGLKIILENELYIIKGQFNLITIPINATYPLTSQFYDDLKTKNTVTYIGLSTFFLKKLAAAVEKSGHKMVALKIREEDKNKPSYTPYGLPIEFCTIMEFTSQYSGELTGLLMPCLIDPDTYNWATKEENNASL